MACLHLCLQLAWRPCQLDLLVRGALPFVLEPNWQAAGDKEMLVLQVLVLYFARHGPI